MTAVTIYHNPACSKSRQALELLNSQGITPTIVLYLLNPPTADQLKTLLDQLSMGPRQLLRTVENDYSELALDNPDLSDDDLIEAMVQALRLIERPIVVVGDKAVIGRPSSRVMALIA